MYQDNGYTAKNSTVALEQWLAINIDAAVIALPDSYVASKGLPVSQRFPWDDSKGIYLVSGLHLMHCTVRSYLHGFSYSS